MSRNIVIKTAAIAVAVGAMTTVAWAKSMKLTDAQLDQVAAGFAGNNQTRRTAGANAGAVRVASIDVEMPKLKR